MWFSAGYHSEILLASNDSCQHLKHNVLLFSSDLLSTPKVALAPQPKVHMLIFLNAETGWASYENDEKVKTDVAVAKYNKATAYSYDFVFTNICH